MLGAAMSNHREVQAATDSRKDAIEQSVCIHEAILADIRANDPLRGGGAISAITQNSSTSLTASISQEGRVELLHYEIKLDVIPKLRCRLELE